MSGYEIRGWCPGALRPMQSGDGWVVRVRPRSGRLTPVQARAIATGAATLGNGLIDLSARANLQIRGVTSETHGPLIDILRDAGLIDADIAAETRRNIVVTPLYAADDGTLALAEALAGRLSEALSEALSQGPDLPGKFGFAVDTGPAPVLGAVSADVRLERAAEGGLVLRADGAATGCRVSAGQAADAAVALAQWFAGSGGVQDGRGRMAAHLARGAAVPADLAGLARPAAPRAAPGPGPQDAGLLVAFEFGQMQAETLAALADAGAALRLTPWRMLLVEGAGALPDLPGLVTDPADPRLRVTACTGAPGCPQGLAPTRPLARALAAVMPAGLHLHLSGCAKGCAHPGPAAITLTATGSGFDLVRNGRAGDPPAVTGLAPEVISGHPQTLFECP